MSKRSPAGKKNKEIVPEPIPEEEEKLQEMAKVFFETTGKPIERWNEETTDKVRVFKFELLESNPVEFVKETFTYREIMELMVSPNIPIEIADDAAKELEDAKAQFHPIKKRSKLTNILLCV